MTMGFSAEDDRLLLRLSTRDRTEYRLWLTRRFVKVLWGALIQTLEKTPEASPQAKGPVHGLGAHGGGADGGTVPQSR